MLRTMGTLLLLMALAACGGGEEQTAIPEDMGLPDEDVETILSIDRSFQEAVKNGDWQVLRAVYAEDAVILPPGAETVEGVDAIMEFWQSGSRAGGLEGFNTDTEVIHGDATIGYHRGTWSYGSGDEMVNGKYLWVLRRMPDGQWKIVADMSNLDS